LTGQRPTLVRLPVAPLPTRGVQSPVFWLIFCVIRCSKAGEIAAEFSEFRAQAEAVFFRKTSCSNIELIQQAGGGNMRNRVRAIKLAANPWSLGAEDLSIVAAFAMWSAIPGMSPALLFHALGWN
jgi:hypothetical protein